MPHIIIEHDKEVATQINLSLLCKSLHSTLADQETVKPEAIKTRTIEIDHVIVADGTNNKMIHVEVRLLGGRSDSLKETMANALFLRAQELLVDISCSLTVNISELGIYKK